MESGSQVMSRRWDTNAANERFDLAIVKETVLAISLIFSHSYWSSMDLAWSHVNSAYSLKPRGTRLTKILSFLHFILKSCLLEYLQIEHEPVNREEDPCDPAAASWIRDPQERSSQISSYMLIIDMFSIKGVRTLIDFLNLWSRCKIKHPA